MQLNHFKRTARPAGVCKPGRIGCAKSVAAAFLPRGVRSYSTGVSFSGFQRFSFSRGSSLITALLVLVVLSTIVVAFMQSMSIERSVARSVANRERAILAAQAAVVIGENAILSAVSETDGYISVAHGAHTFVGLPDNNTIVSVSNSQVAYRPLFSRSGNLSDLTNSISAAVSALPSTNVNGDTVALRPFANTNQVANISWITNSQQDGTPVSRMAFWVEDLQGRVNAATAGNTLSGGAHARPNGQNPSQIALFSVLTNAQSDSSGSKAAQIVAQRPSLLSPDSLFQIADGLNDATQDALTFVQTPSDESKIIPYGFGYPNAGTPKFNLNHYLATANVDAMAGVISTNLPNFATRRGGMPDNYIKTIVASAIDYADTNSTPTVGPDYRGVDSVPFITIIYTKYDWYQKNVGIPGSYSIRMRLSTFVQLWNMSDKAISGTFELRETNPDDIVELGWARNDSTNSLPLAMAPNEIRVLKFEEDLTIPSGALPLAEDKLSLISLNNGATRSDYFFESRWNDSLIGRNRTGAERPAKKLDRAGTGPPDWTGHLPGLRDFPYTTTFSQQQTGDPRSLPYQTTRIAANNYRERTAWGGMATMRANRHLTRPEQWADPVRNTAVSQPSPSSSANISEYSTTTAQLTNGATPPDARDAPQRISNLGEFRSATELGNIFDPAQWHYTGFPSASIPQSATPNARYGGGFSLRIGRPEHPRFETNGLRAVQLLDLFAAAPGSTTLRAPASDNGFRLNLNTAGTNALVALAGGITLTNDQSAGNFTIPRSLAENLARAIYEKRTNAPFFSTTQIAGLTNTNGALFGNRQQWSSGTPPTTFHDAAMEEFFAKVFDFTTTRGTLFRVVGVGQVLDARGTAIRPGAKARIDAIVSVQKSRNTDGAISNVEILKIYESEK